MSIRQGEFNDLRNKEYLGDGVYVGISPHGLGVVLTTWNGLDGEPIFLEAEVMENFLTWADKMRERAVAQATGDEG
jgi:hypothetical protein